MSTDPYPFLDRLSSSWIEEAERQRRAQASTIVCFETTDAFRVRQFLRLKRQEPLTFVYDRWRGLRREGTGDAQGDSDTEAEQQVEEEAGPDLQNALRLVDGHLTRTAGGKAPDLVITDLAELRGTEQDWALVDAVRAWIRDEKAYVTDFTVYVFVASALLFDDQTRRQMIVMPVEVSQPDDRQVVIEFVARESKVELGRDRMSTLVGLTNGLDLRGVYSALLESYSATGDFDPAYLNAAKARLIRSSGLLEMEDPRHGFERVGGYERVRAFLQANVVQLWTDEGEQRARTLGLGIPRGILLFGPPGTGKTLLAKALAREVELPFINFRSENIYASLLGESGQRFAQATKLIDALSPAIVFIDEIDRFGRRSDAKDGATEETRRVFSQMLEWLGDEHRKCLVIGTTNRPGDLDPAFLRAGRFDYKIPMGFPGAQARREILCKHLGLDERSGIKPVPLEIGRERLEMLIDETILPYTEFFKGAELEQFVLRCKRRAAARGATALAETDFTEVLSSFRLAKSRLEDERVDFENQVSKFADDESLVGDS